MNSYPYDIAPETLVSQSMARGIVLAHGIDWDEFLDSYGVRSHYGERSLFTWLGY